MKISRNVRPASVLGQSGRASCDTFGAMEQLEGRQLMTLLGLNFTELPLGFYNSSGQLRYEASSGSFDISATPTSIFLPDPVLGFRAEAIISSHGDFQIHGRVDSSGNFVRGVNAGDSAVIGSVDSAGNDLVLRGGIDIDGNGSIDPVTETGALLTGEMLAFGFQDSGSVTDDYDFRFRVTGGLLASFFGGRDIGVQVNSEASDFVGSFAQNITAQAKGNVFPIVQETPVLGSISGFKFLDASGNGASADDSPLAGTTIYIDANNNSALDAGERSTITDANGMYVFSGLSAGSFTIREVVGAGFLRTQPVLVDNYVVTLATGQNASGFNFTNTEIDCKGAITDISYLINGTRTVTNLRGNTNQGDTVTAIFTIRPGFENVRFTMVSYTAPSARFVASEASQQVIYDLDTGVFGPGTYSLTVVNPDSNYQVDFVCGTAIDVLGPAGSNIFYTPQGRLISADNDGSRAVVANASRINGTVFEDVNNDGVQQFNEAGIRGVLVTLTGTDSTGTNVTQIKRTAPDGTYSFGNLRPGTYSVSETQAAGYGDGIDSAGSAGGIVSNDRFSSIALGAGVNANDYNFGEILSVGGSVSRGETATIGFWNNNRGQALINALNGSSSSEALSYWLATNFPNLWGSNAGSNNLLGRSNNQVASFMRTKFSVAGAPKIEAQILATALAAYVTSSDLAGGSHAGSYGFAVTNVGIRFETISVQSAGSSIGLANNSSQTVMNILRAANSTNAGNALLNGSSNLRGIVTDLFSRINETGDLR